MLSFIAPLLGSVALSLGIASSATQIEALTTIEPNAARVTAPLLTAASTLGLGGTGTSEGPALSSTVDGLSAALLAEALTDLLLLQDNAPPVDPCQAERDALEDAEWDIDEATEELKRAYEIQDAVCDGSNPTLCDIANALVIIHEIKALEAAVALLQAQNALDDCLAEN